MKTERLEWLDVGKGLGMILVIFGHSKIPVAVKAELYTFHLPLFFFLSGYLFSNKKYTDFKVFASKKIASLLIPYFCFSFVLYVWWLIFLRVNTNDYLSLFKPVVYTILGIRGSEWSVNGTLWFVSCLLATELIFYGLYKRFHRTKTVIASLSIFSILGYAYGKYVGIPLPWSIDAALVAVVFYGAGNLFKEKITGFNHLINKKMLFILVLSNVVFGGINAWLMHSRVDMFFNWYGNYFLFYLSAFSGIGAFIIVVKLMKKYAFLKYIGRNSIIYLALHQGIVISTMNLLFADYNGKFERYLEAYHLLGILYTAIVLLIMIPVIYVINKYMPIMIGKKDVNKKMGNSKTEVTFY